MIGTMARNNLVAIAAGGGAAALVGLLLGYAGVIDDGTTAGEPPSVPVTGLHPVA